MLRDVVATSGLVLGEVALLRSGSLVGDGDFDALQAAGLLFAGGVGVEDPTAGDVLVRFGVVRREVLLASVAKEEGRAGHGEWGAACEAAVGLDGFDRADGLGYLDALLQHRAVGAHFSVVVRHESGRSGTGLR